MKTNHRVTSYGLVGCQALGMLLACIPWAAQTRGPDEALLLSAVGACLGFATLWFNRLGNFSVFPEIKNRANLITGGPYRYMRHPMYTALILLMAGIAIYNGHEANYLGLVLVIIAVFGKSSLEERYLLEKFPNYAEYRARTRRFIPWVY